MLIKNTRIESQHANCSFFEGKIQTNRKKKTIQMEQKKFCTKHRFCKWKSKHDTLGERNKEQNQKDVTVILLLLHYNRCYYSYYYKGKALESLKFPPSSSVSSKAQGKSREGMIESTLLINI